MRRSYATVLFLTGLGLALVLSSCQQGGDEAASSSASRTTTEARSGRSYETDPMPVPDTTLTTLDGDTFDLQPEQGHVTLVNFWATWCAPCRKEIPDLVALQDSMGDRGLRIVGIALDDEGASVVEPFVEKYDVTYPIVLDSEGAVEERFGSIYGLPTTYVVNPDGQIVRRILGIFPTDEMRPTLDSMLTAASTASAATYSSSPSSSSRSRSMR